jgi:hypothetical protein
MYPLNTIIVVLKPLYRIPKAGTYWWAIYYKHYKEKLSMVISTYDPYFLITTKEVFGLVGMQTNNTLILALEEFSVIEDNKLSKAKFLIKLKEALAPETLLIFNRCVLI